MPRDLLADPAVIERRGAGQPRDLLEGFDTLPEQPQHRMGGRDLFDAFGIAPPAAGGGDSGINLRGDIERETDRQDVMQREEAQMRPFAAPVEAIQPPTGGLIREAMQPPARTPVQPSAQTPRPAPSPAQRPSLMAGPSLAPIPPDLQAARDARRSELLNGELQQHPGDAALAREIEFDQRRQGAPAVPSVPLPVPPPPTASPQLPQIDPERSAIEGLIERAQQDAGRLAPDIVAPEVAVMPDVASTTTIPGAATDDFGRTVDPAELERSGAKLSPGHFLRRPSAAQTGESPADSVNLIEQRGAPIGDGPWMQMRAEYDAATPQQREGFLALPGWQGNVFRKIHESYGRFSEQVATVPALEAVDQRAEARASRYVAQGAAPDVARNMADVENLAGQAERPAGQLQPSKFDFEASRALKPDGSTSRMVERGAYLGRKTLKQQVLGLHQVLGDLVGADDYAAVMGKAHAQTQQEIETAGEAKTAFERNFEGAIASLISQSPGLAIAIGTGAQAVPLAMMGAQVFGQEYAVGREAGLDKGRAMVRASIQGAAEIVGEKLSLGATTQAMREGIRRAVDAVRQAPVDASRETLSNLFLKSLARENVGEQLTTAIQFWSDTAPEIGLTPDATPEQYLTAVADTLVQTTIQSGIMAGAGMGPAAVAGLARDRGDSEALATARAESAKEKALAQWRQAFRQDGRREPGAMRATIEPTADRAEPVMGTAPDQDVRPEPVMGEPVAAQDSAPEPVATGIDADPVLSTDARFDASMGEANNSPRNEPSLPDLRSDPQPRQSHAVAAGASDLLAGSESVGKGPPDSDAGARISTDGDNRFPGSSDPSVTPRAPAVGIPVEGRIARMFKDVRPKPDSTEQRGSELVTDRDLSSEIEGRTEAAIKSGYSAETAYSSGSRLLKNVEVKEGVGARQADPTDLEVAADEAATSSTAWRQRLSVMDYETLDREFEAARTHNDAVEIEAVRRFFGPDQAETFAGMRRRARERWLEDNITGEAQDYLNAHQLPENLIEEYRDKANDFDTGSPAELGRSVALSVRDIDSPEFFQSPDGMRFRNAMQFARDQGWQMDDVLAGMRSRSVEWAGNDAKELFGRLFKFTSGTKATAGIGLPVPAERSTASVLIDEAAHVAATSPKNDLPEPSQAQKEAGNYRLGHTRIHGLDISIENPEGSDRKGIGEDGKPWSARLAAHYGYVRGTEGADGDHVDVFIGKDHQSDGVYVVDQRNPKTGKFDESKVLLSFSSREEALNAYRNSYTDNANKRIQSLSETNVAGLKQWIESGDTKKPFDLERKNVWTHAERSASREQDANVGQEAQRTEAASGRSPSDLTPYKSRDRAKLEAGKLARAGTQATVIPHPSEPGMFAVAPVQDVELSKEGAQASGKEIDRFAGQYGKGMTLFNASREQKRLTAENPDLDWRIEAAPEFGHDRHAIVGYEKSAPPAAEVETPAAQGAEVAADITVADIHAKADELGIPYDNDPAFMDRTERITGKRHLDDLAPAERQAVLDSLAAQPAPTPPEPTPNPVAVALRNAADAIERAVLGMPAPASRDYVAPMTDSDRKVDTDKARPDAIRKAITKLLNVPINERRFNVRKALGIFKVKPQAIRVRNRNDIDTIGHEVGHHFSETNKEIRKEMIRHKEELLALTPSAYAKERLKLRIEEGFAEFARLYLTDPDIAKSSAPKFHAAFDRFVDDNAYRPIFDELRTMIDDWHRLDPAERIMAKVGSARNSITDRLSESFGKDRLIFEVLDNWLPLKRMVEDLAPGIEASKDPFKAAHLLAGDAAIIEDWMVNATIPFDYAKRADPKNYGKPLYQILKPVAKDLHRFTAYVIAKRADELKAIGKERLYTAAEIKAGLTLETPAFKAAAKELYSYSDRLVDYAVEGGLLSPDTAAKFKEYTSYVPFTRERDDGDGGGRSRNPFRKLIGGTANLRDPISNIIENTAAIIHATNRNAVLLKAHELAKTVPGGGRWIEEVPIPQQAVQLATQRILDELTQQGAKIDPEAARDLAAMQTFFRPNLLGNEAERIVLVKDQGEPKALQINSRMLWQALEAFEPLDLGMVGTILAIPSDLLRAGITLSPEFMSRNFARDTLSGFMQSQHNMLPVLDTAGGFKEVATRSDMAKLYRAFGGAYADLWKGDSEQTRKVLERMARHGRFDPRTILTPAGIIRVLHSIGSVSEAGTRVAEFKKTATGGNIDSLIDAAYDAREVSVDFGMHGHNRTVRFLTRITPFLNPALQGFYKMARTGQERFLTTLLRGSALAMFSVALFLMNRDEDWYDEIEAWERDMYWHMDIGLREDDGRVIPVRIPKPFEWGAAFGSVPEAITAFAIDRGGEEMANRLLSILEHSFGLRMVPTAALVPAELWANKSTFTDRSLVSESKERLDPELQFGPGTSLTAREIGAVVNVSPAKIDHVIRGFLGTMGVYAVGLADQGVRYLGDIPTGPKVQYKQLPVIKAFVRDPNYPNSRHVTEFYELLKKANQASGSHRKYDGNEADRYYAEHQAAIDMAPDARRMARELAELRRQNEEIGGDREYTAEEKLRLMSVNNVEIKKLAKEFVMERARGHRGLKEAGQRESAR